MLHALADSARAVMEKSDAVTLITTDWEPDVPVLSVDYNQSAARNAGISRKDVSMSMLAANGGIPVGSFYDGTHKNTIYLKVTEDGRGKIENLENTPVISMMPNTSALDIKKLAQNVRLGKLDPGEALSSLTQAADINQVSNGVKVEREASVVPRYNGMRAQKVMCSPVAGMETEKARRAIVSEIESINLPAGYNLTWQGEKGASNETMH